MSSSLLAVVVALVGVAQALRCNIVPAGNLSMPDTSSAQECAFGSLTCVKIVDFSRNTYTKQCQALNCTMNGQVNTVANCQNTSMLGINSLSCCCYGDGCNTAVKQAMFPVATFALFAKLLLN